ncbi:MAG: SPASM domain-containing protein [Candidatus Cloacimonetes bacterium]|nr:SPASM domain-containing protein [Candidatus Cloacimonadota bacterium]
MLKSTSLLIRRIFNFHKLWNSALLYTSYAFSVVLRKPLVWGYPPAVMIEPTDVCNLKCPLCPSGNGSLQRAKGFMTLEMYKCIIDQIKPYSYINVLWNQGESFLNPNFTEMIAYSSKMGLYTLASTNANIVMNHDSIVKSGLGRLIVSIDGATQETYNKYRVNGNLDLVINNVKALMEAKKRLKSDTPVIELQFLVMKHNEHEIEAIRRLADELKVDQLRLKTVQIYSKEDVYTYLPENPKYRRYKINGDNFELKFGIRNRCRRIWTNPVINWNGDMAVCCFDKEGSIKLGNIKDYSFIELWKGRKFMAFRKAILTNRKQFDICLNCGEGVKLNIEEKNN